MRLTDRDYQTLGELEAANRNHTELDYRGGWAKPLDCGGSNGSHHGITLAKLNRAGLADRKGYNPGCRPVWMYKINEVGKEALSKYRPPRT